MTWVEVYRIIIFISCSAKFSSWIIQQLYKTLYNPSIFSNFPFRKTCFPFFFFIYCLCNDHYIYYIIQKEEKNVRNLKKNAFTLKNFLFKWNKITRKKIWFSLYWIAAFSFMFHRYLFLFIFYESVVRCVDIYLTLEGTSYF